MSLGPRVPQVLVLLLACACASQPEEPSPTSAGPQPADPAAVPEDPSVLALRRELEDLRQQCETREQEFVAELELAYQRYESAVLLQAPVSAEEQLATLLAEDGNARAFVMEPASEEARSGVLEAWWSGARGEGFLRTEGLPAVGGQGLVYQVFLVDAGRPDDVPIPAGIFGGGRPETLRLSPAVPPRSVDQVLITLEKAPGRVLSLQERLVALSRN